MNLRKIFSSLVPVLCLSAGAHAVTTPSNGTTSRPMEPWALAGMTLPESA